MLNKYESGEQIMKIQYSIIGLLFLSISSIAVAQQDLGFWQARH